MVSGGFGWFRVVLGGFGWFRVVSGGFGVLLGGFGGGFGSGGWFRVVSGGFGSFHLLVSTPVVVHLLIFDKTYFFNNLL